MKFFTVHENPGRPDPDDRVILVKEGWSLIAFAAPVFWLIYHRAWWGLLAYALAAGAFLGLFSLMGLPDQMIAMATGALLVGAPALLLATPQPGLSALGFLFAALCAFEAGDIYRFALARRGYRVIAVVSGKTREEAEQKYFSAHGLPEGGGSDGQHGPWPGAAPPVGHPAARRAGRWASASEPILGLFPGTDRHG